jgi:hypothetical protein
MANCDILPRTSCNKATLSRPRLAHDEEESIAGSGFGEVGYRREALSLVG